MLFGGEDVQGMGGESRVNGLNFCTVNSVKTVSHQKVYPCFGRPPFVFLAENIKGKETKVFCAGRRQ